MRARCGGSRARCEVVGGQAWVLSAKWQGVLLRLAFPLAGRQDFNTHTGHTGSAGTVHQVGVTTGQMGRNQQVVAG